MTGNKLNPLALGYAVAIFSALAMLLQGIGGKIRIYSRTACLLVK
jgi:hypothetical protein